MKGKAQITQRKRLNISTQYINQERTDILPVKCLIATSTIPFVCVCVNIYMYMSYVFPEETLTYVYKKAPLFVITKKTMVTI